MGLSKWTVEFHGYEENSGFERHLKFCNWQESADGEHQHGEMTAALYEAIKALDPPRCFAMLAEIVGTLAIEGPRKVLTQTESAFVRAAQKVTEEWCKHDDTVFLGPGMHTPAHDVPEVDADKSDE